MADRHENDREGYGNRGAIANATGDKRVSVASGKAAETGVMKARRAVAGAASGAAKAAMTGRSPGKDSGTGQSARATGVGTPVDALSLAVMTISANAAEPAGRNGETKVASQVMKDASVKAGSGAIRGVAAKGTVAKAIAEFGVRRVLPAPVNTGKAEVPMEATELAVPIPAAWAPTAKPGATPGGVLKAISVPMNASVRMFASI